MKLVEGTLTLGGETLIAGAMLTEGNQYRTSSGQVLKFCKTNPIGEKAVAPRLVPNTPLKIVALAIGGLLIAYYFILQNQLGQLTNL